MKISIFRKKDTIGATIYIAFVLRFMLFCCWSLLFLTGFSPSGLKLVENTDVVWFAAVPLIIPLFFDKHEDNKLSEKPWAYFFFYLLFVFFCHITIEYSIPGISVNILGKEFESRGRISAKRQSSGGTRTRSVCKHRLSVKDLSDDAYGYTLCTSAEFWNTVSRNDRLILKGKESKYGRLVISWARVKS